MREEDKAFIDREMQQLSPVMPINRKLTKGKRVVTDFRNLNMRIAKNNLVYPLVRDAFSMLANSK